MQKLSVAMRPVVRARTDLTQDLERVASGDVEAFIRVYHAASAKLFGVVVRILGRGDVAEEILQEVYLRIWQKAVDFDAARASPITWLATIARNRALDESRRRRTSSLEDLPEVLEIPSDEDIAQNHLASEQLLQLKAGLGRLPSEQRKVVELIYFEGLTRDQVALRIGQSTGTVNAWLRKSLTQLKGALKP